jgi:hypothetical protein
MPDIAWLSTLALLVMVGAFVCLYLGVSDPTVLMLGALVLAVLGTKER